MDELGEGTRVRVVDRADENYGKWGVVTRGPYRGVLNGRQMVEVRIDGLEWMYDTGYYLDQIDAVRSA